MLRGYRTYIIVWAVLLGLTFVTVAVSYFSLGMLNAVVALSVASVKASLVALYFMHLKGERELIWAFALFPLGFLFLLIGGTAADFILR